ncbi:cytochrome P450 [Streptomyces torulosus]|uniref:cytochrome P450 n=1 Tax=Streptomyces torulosus TaxID=68276 RepID=UPI0006EBB8C0|nr:cytochrome P450 [Streptomyces torulosus]
MADASVLAASGQSLEDEFFNPLSAEMIADPYPAYRRLREHAPVYWHQQLGAWLLTRFTDCQAVLRDSERFAADFRRVGIPTPETLLSLQTLDPPTHTPLRHLGLGALRSLDIEALTAGLLARAETDLSALAVRGEFDFVRDFADSFTLTAMTSLLGVPGPAEDDTFHRLNADLDRSMDSGFDPDAEAAGIRAREQFNALVESWLEHPPKQGVIAHLVEHEAEGGVSRDVLVNSVRAFFHAGFEVPSRFLSNAIAALLDHPHAFTALREGAPMGPAIEELIRFSGPVQALSRACTEDTSIGGKTVRRGEIVVALIGAANRDPGQFSDPDAIRVDRDPNPHLGFGRGSHSCLGSVIGRAEASAVMSAVIRHLPSLRRSGHAVPRPNATLRGLRSLPVAVN